MGKNLICGGYRGTWWVGNSGRVERVKTVERFERRVLRGGVGCVVVGEFSKVEEVRPICLVVVAVCSEVALDYLIYSFRLAIGMWVECSREIRRDSEACDEGTPKLRVEN